jgi:hypothetical protein
MKQTFSVVIDRLGGFFDTVHLTRLVLAEIGDGLEIRGDRFGGALDPSFERIPVFGRNG